MNGGIHAELTDVSADWAAAIVSNDAARIGSFMADEWVMVSESGITSREQFLAVVASGDLSHSAMSRGSEPRIRLHGDLALFTARVTNTAHFKGQTFEADEWTTDVFTRRGGRWTCVLSQITAAVERPG